MNHPRVLDKYFTRVNTAPACAVSAARFILTFLWWISGWHLYAQSSTSPIERDTLTLIDPARHRAIPVAIYRPSQPPQGRLTPVILSHGYNENLPGTYLRYSYLAEFLAHHGCFVMSVQHELPGDEPLAMKGELRTLRRPNWERGVQNMAFVLDHFGRTHTELDLRRTTLIGHSNGGDMSVLFVELHPGVAANLVTLDNRRYPLPRSKEPRVLSLRSNDAPADEGVLPTREEEIRYGMKIIPLNARHNEMGDRASTEIREAITWLVLGFLEPDTDR